MASWEGAKNALSQVNSSVLGSGSCTAPAIVWCVSSALSPPVTAPPVYDKWWGTEWANREVMPVGSLVGQVTVGSRPDIQCSTLLALGLMDRYTGFLHMQKQIKYICMYAHACMLSSMHAQMQNGKVTTHFWQLFLQF